MVDAMMPFIQASSDCKNGASGSPVISQSGIAVAMVSGSHLASTTNFLLPLDRPQRALESLLNGQAILRGTIQSDWIRETRAECFALGLKNQTFEKYCPGGGGLLKAHKILPQGSSTYKIHEGDLLLQVNGQNVISLGAFEDLIDRAVGSSIKIELWRQGLDHEVVARRQRPVHSRAVSAVIELRQEEPGRPVPYTVKVRVTTQSRINGTLPYTISFLSIVVNEIEGFIRPLENDYVPELFHYPIHLEVLHLEHGKGCFSGVLLDGAGNVTGLWLPYFCGEHISVGVPVSRLDPLLESLQKGVVPKAPRLLDVLLEKVPRHSAVAYGVPEDIPHRYFVRVAEVACTHQALQPGDIVLQHGTKSVTEVSDVYGLAEEHVPLSVIRAGTKIQIEAPTITMADYAVDRVVWFCGAQLETPYSPVQFAAGKVYSRI
ncbi:MAG: hypothetical protein Q9207_005636 [Kuettlingeria erythrocarpa]